MNSRTVLCSKLGKEAPGLVNPPFSGVIGQEIYEKVSQEAWDIWNNDLMIKIINEYRLNLAEEKDYGVLLDQMRAFLNLSSSIPVVEVENAERGKQSK